MFLLKFLREIADILDRCFNFVYFSHHNVFLTSDI